MKIMLMIVGVMFLALWLAFLVDWLTKSTSRRSKGEGGSLFDGFDGFDTGE